ncbi:type I polyketide synthase [Nostoc favosum]|uniref:SDR family oxidoreductase n=1 Tax=Nostoc favosum CHAB5714 TaxID=2780399 RepID=A0ABS8IBW4_9NOSO|nr:type I polyketide synthase [Nostoc favosum]MCC5601607.1 SDR family oxidoreductase [Nostoc favosum CHAB5714]
MSIPTASTSTNGSEIAIIGLAGRFPGAKNTDEFWNNLQNCVESISFFSDEELLKAGIDRELLSSPNYIKARGVVDGELFDASFFGFNPREAEITDPQHRIFLECAWEALENAGYKSGIEESLIGVFAGASSYSYPLNVYSNLKSISVDGEQLAIACDKDFLSTRTSYKLNLTGPSYTVQTACSTSLVAVHLACQSLLNGECDMALAGGVYVDAVRKAGYIYNEGGTLSPDGHCRAFDANAQGYVDGEGVGIVVLKRLEDALSHRDTIHAVIKGSATNNDGSLKVSYASPRIDTQAKAIRTAQLVAEVEPETITYIEAHGTGTALGDPIEIAALTQAFRLSTQKKGFCSIGSVKTNIGHLNAAAGVTGLIKTVLALKHKQIPPSLHFETPNPEIDFANSPFYVNTQLTEWKSNGTPRRAGVNSLGLGGTNVHIIIEEAPVVETSPPSRPWQLLMLSAKTSSALEAATANLVDYFQEHPNLNLANAAYTLQVGRRAFDYRRTVVCRDVQDAVNALQDPRRVITSTQKTQQRPIAFMFSGLGTHYLDMALELYQNEPTFSGCVDQCCEILKPFLGLDLRDVLYPNRNSDNRKQKQDTPSSGLDLRKMLGRGQEQADAETLQSTSLLNQTVLTQPAIFVVEYALAQLWISWGIRPVAMIGYSIGEYVAATLAEVLSLEDALTLVARRSQMIDELPEGAMLAVPLSEEEIQPLLNENISLSAINGSSLCVIAGAKDAVEEWERQLGEKNLIGKRLQTSHAFHSVMMEAIAPAFGDLVKTFSLKPPKIPYISNVTGTWITAEQATDPSYWVKHLCQAVRFAQGVQQLWQKDNPILLEVGPGQALISFASQCLEGEERAKLVMLPTLRHSYEQQSDIAFLMNTLGRLWLAGVEVDWSGFYANEQRVRIPLPTYPFERQRYWIDVNPEANLAMQAQQALHKKPNIADWFYIPSWKRSPHLPSKSSQKLCCLVFVDTLGVGSQVVEQLESQGHNVITVVIGERFNKLGDRAYAINPQTSNDYDTLLAELSRLDLNPNAIAHFWSVTLPSYKVIEQTESSHQFFEETQNLGFWSLLFLAQAIGRQDITNSLKLMVVTTNLHDVTGDENLCPEKATVLGPCKVIPQEYPNINCSSVDIVIDSAQTHLSEKLIDNLITELTLQQTNEIIAYRGSHRWAQSFEAIPLDDSIAGKTKLRESGVYLITGGLGDIGLLLAQHLAKTVKAKLILIGRGGLPERSEWEQWLVNHDSQDPVSNKIQKVRSLEELGAEVEVKSADVTNFQEMQAVIAQALQKFGQINGVLHAAGIAGSGIIQLKTQDMASNVLAPKVKGTLVLDEVLKSIYLDFFVLFSSITSILGDTGQVDYCAANAFLDAYAHYKNSISSQFTVSINWDGWQEIGMTVKTVIPSEIQQSREETLKKGILPQEGVDAFNRVLPCSLSQVVVSTQYLQALIQKSTSNNYLEQQLALLEKNLSSVNTSKAKYARPNLANDYVAPEKEIEQLLADIWQEILGIEQIGIHDNFFELGGHSVNAIQIAAKANQANLKFRSEQLFKHQTIDELAANLCITHTNQLEQGLGTKELPLTPIQHWFLKQNQLNIHHCNQSLLLEIQQVCNPDLLEQALQHLIEHHDVFRLRFVQKESGWQQIYASSNDAIEIKRVGLSALSEIEQKIAIESQAAELEASLNLFEGHLVRFAFFDLAAQQTSYLLIIIHQLAVDSISWRILLEDLQTAYQQISQGETIHLPINTISYIQWVQSLQKYAQSSEMIREQDYWLQEMQKPFSCLPVDYSTADNTVANWDTVSVCLSKQDTKALLDEIHKAYNTQINNVLLTALVQAFAKWTGERKLRVDIRDNSREKIFKDVNLSRTVGLLSTCFPAILDITEFSEVGDSLVAIKEYLHGISNNGIGYGVLQYLGCEQEIQSKLRAFPESEVSFNYLGHYEQVISDSSLFALPKNSQGINYSQPKNRIYLIELNAIFVQEQLQLHWGYSKSIHRRETIETLSDDFIEAIRSLIIHCKSVETVMYTPSDFPKANLNKQKLDKFITKISQKIEKINK